MGGGKPSFVRSRGQFSTRTFITPPDRNFRPSEMLMPSQWDEGYRIISRTSHCELFYVIRFHHFVNGTFYSPLRYLWSVLFNFGLIEKTYRLTDFLLSTKSVKIFYCTKIVSFSQNFTCETCCGMLS